MSTNQIQLNPNINRDRAQGINIKYDVRESMNVAIHTTNKYGECVLCVVYTAMRMLANGYDIKRRKCMYKEYKK